MQKIWSQLKLNWRAEGVDKAFLDYYVKNSLPSIRFSLALAFVMYGLFGILDIYMAPQSVSSLWFIRFCIVMPLLALTFGVSFSKWFLRYNQTILFTISLIIGSGILAIIFCTNKNELAFTYYYSGLILCIIWSHGSLRIKARLALISSILLIVGYNVCFLYSWQPFNSINFPALINNNFFLISAVIISSTVSFVTETIFLKNYNNIEIILKEKSELSKSRLQLQEVSAVKTKLLSIISHDLRGPISSIKGILQLFSSNLITAAELKTHLKHLDHTVDSTSDLLDNLLSWSVMQIEGKIVKNQVFYLRGVGDEIFRLFSLQAAKKNIRLTNNIDPEMCVLADLSTVNLVLRNLVSNSLKYTQEGQILISADFKKDRQIEISVSDTGIGIPSSVAAELFSWEKRQSRIRPGTQSERGSGMGLIICKEFIEKQGGQLYFLTKEGSGTTFYMAFPDHNDGFHLSSGLTSNDLVEGRQLV